MTIAVLPLNSADPAYTVDVDLGGVLFRLRLAYNTRLADWTLAVLTVDDVPIVEGVRLVADWDLLSQFKMATLPVGRLASVDNSGQGLPATADDLGTRVMVVHDDDAVT